MPPTWEVVGGADRGGILVRDGEDLTSRQKPERLSTGALIEEVRLVGDRLCYRRLTGTGPSDGWVGTKLPGKDLCVRTSKTPPAASSQADGRAGEGGTWEAQGLSTMFPGPSDDVAKKTPMGRQLNIFGSDQAVDTGFGSPHMILTDRLEMTLWLTRTMKKYNASLGDEVSVQLMSKDASSPAVGGQRMKIIYIAGVEGTGHHGIMPMLLFPVIKRHGGCTCAWWRSLREVLMKTPPAQRPAKLEVLMDASKVHERSGALLEWCSWPFGEENRERWSRGCLDPSGLQREVRSGNPGNSVDLEEFVELFSKYGDVRVLVLHRDLAPAAWSHRQWDGGPVPHAHVLALFNDYLTKVLGRLDRSLWRWVQYEDLCEAHHQGKFESIAPLADFLGLEKTALERSFRHFTPSHKDADTEVPPAELKAIKALELQHQRSWFPHQHKGQQLLGEFSVAPGERRKPPPPPPEDKVAATEVFMKVLKELPARQQQLFADATRPSLTAAQATQRMQLFQDSLTEDQKFLFKKTMVVETSNKFASKADVDPAAYTGIHFWIGGCGFGSEINNLISAAVYCEQYGLECVVEDENWNSGRLSDYLETEPVILNASRIKGTSDWRPLEVKRDKRVATVGWFAVCKHARSFVSFAKKSNCARRLWRYTPHTRETIGRLNAELDLPQSYITVQIRRGDKIAGKTQETLKVKIADYARAAFEHCKRPAAAIVVCTDDVTAAREFEREYSHLASRARGVVRWRRQLLEGSGHDQPAWNAKPLEERAALTHEFLADVELMRASETCICTHSSNVGRLVALLRDGPTISLDSEWTNT